MTWRLKNNYFKVRFFECFFWNRERTKASRALLGKLEPRDSFQCPKVSGQLPVQTNIQKPIPELQAQWAQLAKFGQLCQCSHPWEWDPLSGINKKLDAKILKPSPKNGISCPFYILPKAHNSNGSPSRDLAVGPPHPCLRPLRENEICIWGQIGEDWHRIINHIYIIIIWLTSKQRMCIYT